MLQAEIPRIDCDILVVGSGISGLSAAISAREHSAEAIIIEKAPIEERGGNTKFADAQTPLLVVYPNNMSSATEFSPLWWPH